MVKLRRSQISRIVSPHTQFGVPLFRFPFLTPWIRFEGVVRRRRTNRRKSQVSTGTLRCAVGDTGIEDLRKTVSAARGRIKMMKHSRQIRRCGMTLVPATLMRMAALVVLTFGCASIATSQNTSTVTGTVVDASGAVIPDAPVSVVSETRGTTFPTKSGATGDFIITNIPGDTYTIRVTVSGFRKAERTGVLVVPGDRVALGTITLEVGGADTSIEVTAQAQLLQAQTGDRTSTVTETAVRQVPTFSSGTFFAQAALLAPGVNAEGTTTNPGRLDTVSPNGTNQSNARTNWVL